MMATHYTLLNFWQCVQEISADRSKEQQCSSPEMNDCVGPQVYDLRNEHKGLSDW